MKYFSSLHLSVPLITALSRLTLFALIWALFWFLHRGVRYFYFDAQDYAKFENNDERKLPVSAATGTFTHLLQHYIDVTKLLITVAAASIAFGGNQNGKAGILIAKFTLAFSILYGVLFCAAVLYMYDEYGQNLEVYTRFWYSTVETLGFSALICFVVGYGVWALNVG
jgi:hypothetical protein